MGDFGGLARCASAAQGQEASFFPTPPPAAASRAAHVALCVHALRFHLLLPSSPIDPSLRPSLKGANTLSAQQHMLSALLLRQCIAPLQGACMGVEEGEAREEGVEPP